MNKVKVYTDMKGTLLERGWTQGDFKDFKGKVCLLGALNQCNLNLRLKYIIQDDMEDVLSAGVAAWNDTPERTFNEVIGFLDVMILREKEAGNDQS